MYSDYELLFTAPSDLREEILQIAERAKTRVSRIGEIVSAAEPMKIIDEKGTEIAYGTSFNHFGGAGS